MRQHGASCSPLTRLIPSFAGWDTFPRATLNFLIAAIAVAWTIWTVHQTEYLLVYGNRFEIAMQTAPHAVYMGPYGLFLLVTGGALAAIVVLLVSHLDGDRHRIQRALPASWGRSLSSLLPGLRVEPGTVLRTAGIFAVLQIFLYTIQENLESGLAAGTWPGLSVLWGVHLAVVPLHVLGALCASCLLWLASRVLATSRVSLALARTLQRLSTRPCETDAPLRPGISAVPVSPFLRGPAGARAPPAA